MLGLDSRYLPRFEEAIKAFVLKTPNHNAQCNPSCYGCQLHNAEVKLRRAIVESDLERLVSGSKSGLRLYLMRAPFAGGTKDVVDILVLTNPRRFMKTNAH